MTVQTIPEAAATPLPAAANDVPHPSRGTSAVARVAVGGDGAGPGPQLDEIAAGGGRMTYSILVNGAPYDEAPNRLTATIRARSAGFHNPEAVIEVERGGERVEAALDGTFPGVGPRLIPEIRHAPGCQCDSEECPWN